MKGRKPKPAAVLRATGSRRLETRGDEPEPRSGKPTVPGFLDKIGKAEFRRIVRELEGMNTLASADRAGITALADAWSRLAAGRLLINREGLTVTSDKGVVSINPAVRIAQNATDHITRLSAEFGLTPSSRSRVTVTQSKDASPESLEAFMQAAPTFRVGEKMSVGGVDFA